MRRKLFTTYTAGVYAGSALFDLGVGEVGQVGHHRQLVYLWGGWS